MNMSQNSALRIATNLLFNNLREQQFQILRNFSKTCYAKSQEQIFHVMYSDKPPEIPKEDMIEIKKKERPEKHQPKFNKMIPIIKCKRPEFNHYKNQTYEKFSVLPLASAGWNNRKSKGDYFTINVFSTQSEKEAYFWDENIKNFEDLGLNKYLVESLRRAGIERPTKIQVEGIPVILGGSCSVLAAETGCGKTLTYLLPIVERMEEWKRTINQRPPNHPLALIITPGRELARQIKDVASSICSSLMVNCHVITGGHLKRVMLNPKFEHVDILVASVGAISKLTSSGIYNLSEVQHIVLDEADTLLDDSFSEYLIKLLRRIPFGHKLESHYPNCVQLTLASATMPEVIPNALLSLVPDHSLFSIQGNRLHHIQPHVPQHFIKLNMTERPGQLISLVRQSVANKHPVMVFSNRTATCDWASMFMNENGINAVNLNGEMPFDVRLGKFQQFQHGEFDVLSCTDVGSRGLDTRRVKHVINYDFPHYIADYIHRCGRTGRVGMNVDCKVTNFVVGKRDVDLVQEIETSIRKFSSLPDVKGNITRLIRNRIMRSSQYR